MRNRGSKDARPRFSTMAQMQARSGKLADQIDKYITQAYARHGFVNLVDFDKLHQTKDHLKELSSMRIQD